MLDFCCIIHVEDWSQTLLATIIGALLRIVVILLELFQRVA